MTTAGTSPIPVTVLTGYLGSGKTTLLRRLLRQPSLRLAVIENEFASNIGTENELCEDVQHAACTARIVETTSGCLCCTGSKDFSRVLNQLIDHREKFDAVIIETTGLADPTFAATFFNDPRLRTNYRLDAIVTLVDAQNVRRHLNGDRGGREDPTISADGVQVLNETEEQVALADRIILNKVDLVSAEELDEVEKMIASLNPSAPITRAEYSNIDPSSILGIGAFDLNTTLQRDKGFLDFRPYRQHDPKIQSVALRSKGDYSLRKVEKWIKDLLQEKGGIILRTKGIVHADGRRYVLQGVHSTFALEPNDHIYVPHGSQQASQSRGIEEETRRQATAERINRFVFIGRDLHPAALIQHYRQYFDGGRGSTTSGDGLAPPIELEAWTRASQPQVGLRWSGIILLGILFIIGRYRSAVMGALGLPEEWAWMFALGAVLAAFLIQRLLGSSSSPS